MKHPTLNKNMIQTPFSSRFLNMHQLAFDTIPCYFEASRHAKDDLVCLKDKQQHAAMLPDAVSCCVIVEDEEPKLLVFYEYRYPIGQSILSIPAGLIDKADTTSNNPLFTTAIREIYEETGLQFDPKVDTIKILSPLLFSSPGMTDESNAFVSVHLHSRKDLGENHAEGGEQFENMKLITKQEALEILHQGHCKNGLYFSVYTWMALTSFVSGLYEIL